MIEMIEVQHEVTIFVLTCCVRTGRRNQCRGGVSENHLHLRLHHVYRHRHQHLHSVAVSLASLRGLRARGQETTGYLRNKVVVFFEKVQPGLVVFFDVNSQFLSDCQLNVKKINST